MRTAYHLASSHSLLPIAGALVALAADPTAQQVTKLGQTAPPQGVAPEPAPEPRPSITFADATAEAGIATFTFSNTDHSGGVAWIDYNGDFWPDLFLTNGLGWDHVLYRNNGDGTFTDVSSVVAKPTLALESCASLFGDFDGDGDSDLLVVVDSLVPGGFPLGGPNLLYMNQGDGTFLEQAASRGIVDPDGHRNTSGALGDFDGDGDLDVFFGMRAIQLFPLTHFDWMALNDGTGVFTDETVATGVAGAGGNAQLAIPLDVNLDGAMDIYVGNVGTLFGGYTKIQSQDALWVNSGSSAPFTNVIASGVDVGNDATAAMGADIGDIDNDGDWDLYITDNPTEGDAPNGNVLYLGDGAGNLQDNTCDLAGVCTTNQTWPCNFADFDRDGWVDLWVGTLNDFDDDLLYRNDQDGTFTMQPQPVMVGNRARGGSIADYDGDGDVDIAFWNAGQNSPLYRNDTADSGHFLQIKLFGTSSTTDAIGALVKLTAGGITQMRRVSGGDSAHSQKELLLHFGLGAAVVIDTLEIQWPSGTSQTFTNLVEIDEVLFVDESAGILSEAINVVEATWSAGNQELRVEVTSSFGGRTDFDVTGFGPLDWSPDTLSFALLSNGVASNPGNITVTSRRGASFPVTVTAIP